MLVADLQVAVDIPQLYVVIYDLKTVPIFILKAWGFECEHIRIGIFQYIWCNNCFIRVSVRQRSYTETKLDVKFLLWSKWKKILSWWDLWNLSLRSKDVSAFPSIVLVTLIAVDRNHLNMDRCTLVCRHMLLGNIVLQMRSWLCVISFHHFS